MPTNYDNFSKTFSNSRKNMKWEEIQYFIDFIKKNFSISNPTILDIGCGNGRLVDYLLELDFSNYIGIDSSEKLLQEAKKLYKNQKFIHLNMLDLDKFKFDEKFDFIFFIASFHHLENFSEREKVLIETKKLLKENGIIFMTNWNLKSALNRQKYSNSVIANSLNEFGSEDYNIKIGKFSRYYHSFSIEELDFLFRKSGFEVVENREFENLKNLVSILKNN